MLEVKDLFVSYGMMEVLHGINMKVESGEFVALLGHNGCGKSTLAKIFNGMYIPSEGSVTIDGISTLDENHQIDVRRRVGLVQQNPDNQLVAGIVEEDVAFVIAMKASSTAFGSTFRACAAAANNDPCSTSSRARAAAGSDCRAKSSWLSWPASVCR